MCFGGSRMSEERRLALTTCNPFAVAHLSTARAPNLRLQLLKSTNRTRVSPIAPATTYNCILDGCTCEVA